MFDDDHDLDLDNKLTWKRSVETLEFHFRDVEGRAVIRIEGDKATPPAKGSRLMRRAIAALEVAVLKLEASEATSREAYQKKMRALSAEAAEASPPEPASRPT